LSWQQKLQYSVVLLVALGAVAVGSFRFGAVHVSRSHAAESRVDRQTPLLSEGAALEAQLESRAAAIDDLATRLQERTAAVQELKRKLAETASLEASRDNELNAALAQNTSFVTERDSLLRRLHDSEASVVSLRGELDSLRAQRQGDLLRVSSLEARIEELNGRLNESQETVAQQQDFLVSDRDIRELMGARSLYITDVVDVDKNGHTRKPFGRIFYTKGKSLVFYAFDLDQQRGLHNAAFQLWGQRGADRNGSVNMGIFYLDNEANRRWVLKFDNPEKLAQINAVFVTVEPNGGSQKPAGKQLLYASLRSLPNHP
jgi:TolA-binding protein